jgi:ABC-2 type transport system ATP-binding protein
VLLRRGFEEASADPRLTANDDRQAAVELIGGLAPCLRVLGTGTSRSRGQQGRAPAGAIVPAKCLAAVVHPLRLEATVTFNAPAIVVERLQKAFGPTIALQGVELIVEPGTVQALLGPNGAGKSTLVRILSTLVTPDAGRALICGVDVVRDPQRARSLIGLAGQSAAVDETLTGRENLELVGRLYGLGHREAAARAAEVLERLSLTAAADRRVFTYSGGMRRRLDVGASLVGRPMVLIMDEPTTGLDPDARRGLWGLVGELARHGTTVLLTTQYLEEADRLANQIAVIHRGRIVASGTPDELKDRLGRDVFEVRARDSVDVEPLRRMLVGLGSGEPVADLRWQRVTLPTADPVSTLLSAGNRIEESGIAVEDLGVRRPTLDDVFLTLTAGQSGSPSNGTAVTTPPNGDGDEVSERAVPRRRRVRRHLSYLLAAVAALAAGLAVALISVSPQPHRRPDTPVRPRAGASISGITRMRNVSLGATPGGLTADASGNLWLSLPASGSVARVTASGRAQTFRVGGHPTAIAAAFDRVWIAGSSLGPLASLNIVTGQPLSSTTLQGVPTAIAVDSDDNSACTIDSSGVLTHIDSTGGVLGQTHLSHAATGVGCGEGWVWAVQPGPPALVRMGDYGGTTSLDGGPAPVAITFDRGIWIANSNGSLAAFDPRPGHLRVTHEIALAPELDGVYANENDRSVWAISRQTRALYRISNTAPPSLIGTVGFNSPPVALVVVGRSVWVATQDGNLTQIRY